MKILIWDFNGTIIDDAQLCLDIENEMLKNRGMHYGYTIEEYRDLFCFPVKDYYRKLGYTFENESYETISEEFNARYEEGFPECTLVQYFEEKIREAEEKGYRNVILSASQIDVLKNQCMKLNIYDHFDEILGIDNIYAGSKIDMAKAWMKERNYDPKDMIYIGDTTHDKETADALGIENCYLAAAGHQSFNVLNSVSDQAVRSLREVLL